MSGSREVWQRRVSQWKSSGLTAKAFSSRHGIAAGSLSWWAWRLRRDARRPTTLTLAAVIELHPAVMADDRFEVVVGKCSIRVPPTFDAPALRRLVGALEDVG